jgi:hypothetical protein
MNRAAVVGWGTMLNVAHFVRGIRTLHAVGQGYATLPLLRSVMEYALGYDLACRRGRGRRGRAQPQIPGLSRQAPR